MCPTGCLNPDLQSEKSEFEVALMKNQSRFKCVVRGCEHLKKLKFVGGGIVKNFSGMRLAEFEVVC